MSIVPGKSIVLCVSFLLVFISFRGLAFDVDLEVDARPACNQYCDEIKWITILHDGSMDENFVRYMEKGITNVIADKGYSDKIKVASYRIPKPMAWNQSLTHTVSIEISEKEFNEYPISIVSIEMIAPAGAYSQDIQCVESVGDEKDQCIRNGLKSFISKAISKFLFDNSILNRPVE